MRIHRLEIQAFGPFAGRQRIDFDELGAQGLFLLNGQTGAGKTSVLDAVCFALYGSVPGARQNGKRLRSDHAEATTAPEVVCEFSARGRRFEVTRSPQWDRPSARSGKGTTVQQAKTLLRERIGGSWVEKSARSDEAAVELGELLGMSLDQFTKVVLLPQGEFAAFLRADAKERRPLLQRLFNTQRFEAVEQALALDAGTARTGYDQARAAVEQLLRAAREEAARHLNPGEVPEEAATGAAELEQLQRALAALAGRAAAEAAGAAAELEQLRRLVTEQEQRLGDHAELAMLEELEDKHRSNEPACRQLAEDLEAHRRAELLAAPIRHRDQAAAQAGLAREQAGRLAEAAASHPLYADYAAELPAPPPGGDPEETLEGLLAEAADRAGARLGQVQALLPEEERLRALADSEAQLEAGLLGLSVEMRRTAEQTEALRAEAARLQADLQSLQTSAADVPDLERGLEAAEALAATVTEHEACRAQLAEAAGARDEAKALQLDLKERWLDLLQQRLDNAAAELASRLEDGVPCPVCGSAEHPAPAGSPTGRLVGEDEEAAARQKHGEAEARLARAQQECSRLEARLAALAARGGETPADEAEAAVEQARTGLEAARQAAQARERLESQAAAAAAALEELARQAARLDVDHAAAGTELRAVQAQREELGRKLAELTPAGRTLAEHAGDLSALIAALSAAAKALDASRHAEASLERSQAELAAAIADSAFDGEEQVHAALLSAADLKAMQAEIEDHTLLGQRLQLLQDSEKVVRARRDRQAGPALPAADDVEVLRGRAAELEQEVRDRQVRSGVLQASDRQLQSYGPRLAEAAAELEAARERYERIQSVADTVRGLGENDRKMTLTTYVLAARLEQIAAAASERLAAMTDGRYTLVHDDSKSGNKKSGLGLHVNDAWTGQRRDTATLSGGESFMASLALALGLADVVQAEAGGVDIETLFVDEGFGSLDEQALEQVMDALEGLRDGGRMVGLVSHVPEMKLRIPAQLQVAKGRQGSTVQLVFAETGAV
ncbi:AAA family ATPase [Arthrobacter mobilis]|uniref:Nuclease SbcCD subunit C n=1 Tax=Arthrobacter mobilis TaxID=2724944 RepID=A0A7X6HE52_9MICC|nr:SMC family ATPase [Arthrobacter mobilis]NKX54599.1 SMC family ATPase [Arthrobacter mobilis]